MSVLKDAKELFRANEQMAREFGELVYKDSFQVAATYAMTQFVNSSPAPTEVEIKGARRFLEVFVNLAEANKPAPVFPVKTLEYDSEREKLNQKPK